MSSRPSPTKTAGAAATAAAVLLSDDGAEPTSCAVGGDAAACARHGHDLSSTLEQPGDDARDGIRAPGNLNGGHVQAAQGESLQRLW